MCFYDVILMNCNCWKWGHLRQHCTKEFRTGETCGLRLTNETTRIAEKCKICKKIESKKKAIYKEESNVARWRKEHHGRNASIETSQDMIRELQEDVMELEREWDIKLRTTDSMTGLAIPGEWCTIPQTFDSSSTPNPLAREPNQPGFSKKELLGYISPSMTIDRGLPPYTFPDCSTDDPFTKFRNSLTGEVYESEKPLEQHYHPSSQKWEYDEKLAKDLRPVAFDALLPWGQNPNRLRSRTSVPSSQEITSSSKLRGTASPSVAKFATQHRTSPENQRKVLRVLIKNKEHLACPDSGSAKNIMSECLANKCRLKIRRGPKDIKQFELGSGKSISSVGRVRVPVELLGNTLGRKKYWFYVFSKCPVPLILGMPFLEEAEILTKNRHTLESCLAELSNISSLLWIGSSRCSNSPRNRFECSLDGHKLEAIADTGSDLNFISLKCAKREGFQINRRREARRRIRVGDGTEAETIGQVYIYNLSLDWRKATTTPDIPAEINSTVKALQDPSPEINEPNFGAIFHVLPGLPFDVIFGQDLLDQADAFNLYPNLYSTRPAKKDNPFEFNVLISLGPVSIILSIPWRRRKYPVMDLDPKETHDNARHAEMFWRTKKEEEIALLPIELRDLARSRERSRIKDWDAFHRTCIYCNPV